MAAMMMNLAVAPTMAKPDTITIIIKDSDTKKPATSVPVSVNTFDNMENTNTYSDSTDSHGKISFDVDPDNVGLVGFQVNLNGAPYDEYLSNAKDSFRIIILYP